MRAAICTDDFVIARSAIASQTAFRRPKLTAIVESVLKLCRTHTRKVVEPLASIPSRLLVVKVHGMGDSVLIRSIVEQLRERHPDMRIGVLAGSATREILSLSTDFQVHLYTQKELSPRSAFALLREIRRANYHAVLNFEQASIAGTAFLGATGIPIRIGFIPLDDSPKAIFLTHGVGFEETRSMWQSFITLARIIDPGLSATARMLRLGSRPETVQWVEDWWHRRIKDDDEVAIVLHLGCSAGMNYRRWPLERFVALAEQINLNTGGATIVLTGTTIDRPLIEEFMKAYAGRAVDASEAGSLDRTATILRRCQLLVSVDTGVMHLGAALGVPTVGLFGPNTPRHWAPIGLKATYVYDTVIACSPCINNYQNRLPPRCTNVDQGRCMRDISPESVMVAARSVVPAGFFGGTSDS